MATHRTTHRSSHRSADPERDEPRSTAGRRTPARVRATRERTLRPAEVAVFVLIAGATALASCLPTPADGATGPTVTRAIRVEQSDTLWSIAQQHAAPGGSTADMVETLRQLNGLGARDTLQPGTYVRVPCADTGLVSVAQR